MANRARELAARGNRQSASEIDGVKKTAERAGLQLAREQDDSVSQVAQALARITEEEGLADLDGRLSFIERQVERLSARREESDRLVDSELAVMRARLEDTLTAFAAATQEHREVMSATEQRLELLASEAERHMLATIEGLRQDLSAKVEGACGNAPNLEARLLGEKRAFREEATKRTAALDARIGVALDLQAAAIPDRDEMLRLVRKDIESVRLELLDGLQAMDERALGASVHLESVIQQVRRRLIDDEAEWSSVIGEAGSELSKLRGGLEDLLARVCALEAEAATDRGSAGVQLEGFDRRLGLAEQSARGAVTEVSELALRCKAVESSAAAATAVRILAEEQAGELEYLKQRLYELGEQVEAMNAQRAADDGTAVFWPPYDAAAPAPAPARRTRTIRRQTGVNVAGWFSAPAHAATAASSRPAPGQLAPAPAHATTSASSRPAPGQAAPGQVAPAGPGGTATAEAASARPAPAASAPAGSAPAGSAPAEPALDEPALDEAPPAGPAWPQQAPTGALSGGARRRRTGGPKHRRRA